MAKDKKKQQPIPEDVSVETEAAEQAGNEAREPEAGQPAPEVPQEDRKSVV